MSDDYFFHPAQTRPKHYISPDKKYSLRLIIYLTAFSKARVGLITGTATRNKIQLFRLVFSLGLRPVRASQASKYPLQPPELASQERSQRMVREKSRDIRSMEP
jgi:hypothetical protein